MTEEQHQRPRLILADDHPGMLESVRVCLSSNFEVLRSVCDGAALVQAAAELRPDAVVSDLHMTGLNGIDACQQILEQGWCAAAVILTLYNEPLLAVRALRAGIRGYVLKVDAGDELIPALEVVLKGGSYVSQGIRLEGAREVPLG